MSDEPSTDDQEQDDNDNNEPVSIKKYYNWGCSIVFLIGGLGWTMIWYLVGGII